MTTEQTTPRRAWRREELLLALRLYFHTPFGRLHRGNPEILRLAKDLGRTPSAVAMKASNFASLDPGLAARGNIAATPAVTLHVSMHVLAWSAPWSLLFSPRSEQRGGRPIPLHLRQLHLSALGRALDCCQCER